MPKENKSGQVKKKRSPSINLRVNILFTVIFMLFMTLVGRLYYMQVLDRSFYADKLKESGIDTTITTSFPRGQVFDAQGKPLATTVMVPSVTFTHNPNITADEMRQNALKMLPILRDSIDPTGLTDYDKKDYFLADPANLKAISAKLPESQQVDSTGKRLTEAQKYELYIKLVPSDQIQYQGDDLLAAELYKLMNGTKAYSMANIVSNVPDTAMAQLAPLLGTSLPGVSIGSDWDYNIDENNLLSPLMGSISSAKAGLPNNPDNKSLPTVAQYLAKGYQMNDRVGTSFLQQSYEDVLQGKHEIDKIAVDSKGNVKSSTVTQAGAQGKNLKLTVDLNFENAVQSIIQDNMNQIAGQNPYSKGIYAVVENSSTGAILSMNGISRDTTTGEQKVDSSLPMLSAFIPGSTVKPGTLTAGWETGAISGNQVITSQPIQLAGSNPIRDWNLSGFGPISADLALAYSSNTYMVQVALKSLGQSYTPGMMVNTTNLVKSYDAFRSAYGQYGLGTSTGIDIPGENTGAVPSSSSEYATAGNFLNESFGQFDTYTPLQLAQYAQTIANNGNRMAPHIVEGIYSSNDSTLGKEETAIAPKLLNKVNISQDQMDVIHLGMNEVVYGASGNITGRTIANGAATEIYAKTGTSEEVAPDGTTGLTVHNVIAFAPGPSPQIAIGIMVPGISSEDNASAYVNQRILTQIVNKAVEMKVIK